MIGQRNDHKFVFVRFAAYRQEMPGRAGDVRTLSKATEEFSFRAETALSGGLNSTLLAYKHISASTMSGFWQVMFITVAICTFNRAESLRRTLDSLIALQIPDNCHWEILVVNNNSRDHTDEVVNRFRELLPIRLQFEPRPGLSNARNRAVDAARGQYTLWTDDDVIVDAGWLAAYMSGFRRWPEAAVFGGRITPIYEEPVAKWVKQSEALLKGPYGVREFGNNILPLSVADDRLPFGANFAIRTSEQRAFRYDPDLGVGPKRRRAGEEIDVVSRILQSGATGYWLPTARLLHFITKDMQTIGHIARCAAAAGETDARQGVRWLRAPRRVWPLKRWLRYRYHRLMSPAPIWVGFLQDYAYARGAFRFYLQQKTIGPRTT